MKMAYDETISPQPILTATNQITPSHTRPKPYQVAPRSRDSASAKVMKEAGVQDERSRDVVYTGGSCTGNGVRGAKAGIGVWWGQ